MRPIDLPELEKKLVNGLKNTSPQSILAYCLKAKKTIRLGNKTDPFQPAEEHYRRSTGAIEILTRLEWSYVVQTRFPSRMWRMARKSLRIANLSGLVTLLPIISPGLELDWEILEGKQTEPIGERLEAIRKWLGMKNPIPTGVQGEPYIPGFHTPQMFEDAIIRLKEAGVVRYNTYNFHFTPHVAKRLAGIPEVDIERIWYYNQDAQWRKILPQLLDIASRHGIILGCPDFVNSGRDYREKANTCCGIDVPNPCTFNTHYFKKLAQDSLAPEDILEQTWDGSGNWEEGMGIVYGTNKDMFSLKDAGFDFSCKKCKK